MIFDGMSQAGADKLQDRFVSAIDTVNGWEDPEAQRLGTTLIGLAAFVTAAEANPRVLDKLAQGIEYGTARMQAAQGGEQ